MEREVEFPRADEDWAEDWDEGRKLGEVSPPFFIVNLFPLSFANEVKQPPPPPCFYGEK